MRKHAESILKLVCLILAALVLWQLITVTRRINPLHNVTVPPLPVLTASANNTGNRSSNPPMASSPSTGNLSGTNSHSSSAIATNSTGTNLAVSVPNSGGMTTNVAAKTNATVTEKITQTATNAVMDLKTNGTNTGSIKIVVTTGTNLITHSSSTTSAIGKASTSSHLPPMNGGGMGFNPRGGHTDLPPAIQAQLTKIIDSEILGPVPHPLPMALMGIAGDVAFLRAPDGQSGMVKLGDSLGEIKLVRIGINRVLVEQDGQSKELTIFDGHGSESLLDKQGGTNNETHE